jgi:hypothetical protein
MNNDDETEFSYSYFFAQQQQQQKKLKINIHRHRHRGSKKGSTPLKNKFKLNKNFLVMQIANKSLPVKSSTFAWCQKNKLIEKFS